MNALFQRGERELCQRQADLLSRLRDSLGRMPGSAGLTVFGSLAGGGGDGFSDIDIRVLCHDLAASVAARRQALSEVGSILLEWRIWPAEEPFAATILFRDESCYHKLDLGFVPAGGGAGLSSEPAEEDPCETDPYAPLVGSPGHRLIDQLLGATRYVKARRRNQHVTCWRFAAAAAEQVLRLTYESCHRWQDMGRRLTTSDYIRLDEMLGQDAALGVTQLLRFDTARAMDASLVALCQSIAELSLRKASAARDRIPAAPIAKLLGFLEGELIPPRRATQ